MKNKLIIGMTAITMCTPAMADIGQNATSATCDSATIGATSGNAYMDTAWTANTINLDFYSDGEKISTGSCTYDGVIELPEDPEDKTGYTFGGWKMRAAAPAASTFDLSTLAQYMDETGGTRYYQKRNKSTGATECIHNASGSWATVDCSDPLVSDLTMSEWKVDFTYGTVKGIGRCSLTLNRDTTPTDDWMQGKYCWCQATAFDAEKDGSFLPVASSSWVYRDGFNSASNCANSCASYCSRNVAEYGDFRRALFGVTE